MNPRGIIRFGPFTGLNTKDEPYHLKPEELSDVQNMIIDKRGNIKRRLGIRKYNTTSLGTGSCYGLARFYHYVSGTFTKVFVLAYGTKLYYATSSSPSANPWTEIATGLTASNMRFEQYRWKFSGDTNSSDALFMCNGTDFKVFGYSTSAADYVVEDVPTNSANYPTSLKPIDIVFWKDRLFAIGGDYPHFVYYTELDTQPLDWDDPNNYIAIHEGGQDPLLRIIVHNDRLFLFKATSVHEIAGSSRLDWENVIRSDTDGVYAQHSLVSTARGMVYLARRGILLYDGIYPPKNLSEKITPDILDLPDTYINNATGHYDRYNDRYYIAVTRDGQTYNDTEYIYDFYLKGWVKFQGRRVCANGYCSASGYQDTATGNLYIADSNNGIVYECDVDISVNPDDAGTSINAYFQTAYNDADTPHLVKRFRRLWGWASGSGGNIQCEVFLDYLRHSESVSLNLAQGSALWGSLIWDTDDWAGTESMLNVKSLGHSAFGRNISIKCTADINDEWKIMNFQIEYASKRRAKK